MNLNSNLLNAVTVMVSVAGFATLLLVVLFSLSNFIMRLDEKFDDLNDVELPHVERDNNEDRKK